MIWRNHVVAICKRGEERLPARKPTRAVQEQRRVAAATPAHERAAIANRYEIFGNVRHVASPHATIRDSVSGPEYRPITKAWDHIGFRLFDPNLSTRHGRPCPGHLA